MKKNSTRAYLSGVVQHETREGLEEEINHREHIVPDVGVHVCHGAAYIHHQQRQKRIEQALSQ